VMSTGSHSVTNNTTAATRMMSTTVMGRSHLRRKGSADPNLRFASY
jgi:hypothetical protein